jgi:hypothetical protein
MNINNFEIIEPLGDTFTEIRQYKGLKVKCISVDETQSRWGGNDSAEDYLVIGNIYTLAEEPEVHSWHTKYYLKEVPGKKFNSVQFELVD